MADLDRIITEGRAQAERYRASVGRCCGWPVREGFCESFGCKSVAELLSIIDSQAASLVAARELLEAVEAVPFRHADDYAWRQMKERAGALREAMGP